MQGLSQYETLIDTKRVGFSPAEFAAAFGKHPAFAYRLLYSGKIKAVSNYGRLCIPATELERVMAEARPYNPKPKKRKTEKAEGEEVANVSS